MVSCGHCIACPSVLITTFGIFWSLYCLSFSSNYYLWYLVVIVLPVLRFWLLPLVSCGHCIACPSVLIITVGILWSLYCLSFGSNYYIWYLVVIVLPVLRFWLLPLVSCGHCICLSFGSNYYLWYIVVIVLPVLRFWLLPLVSSGHCITCPSVRITTFGILWSLYLPVLRF